MADEWTTANPSWEQRIVARESLLPCGPLFPDEAEASLAVFDDLHVADIGARMGDACAPWMRDFAACLFGAIDEESGRRLIREYFLMVAKKNFKSGLGAAIMLTELLRNSREGAEFLLLAPTLEVARNAYEPARAMIRADDELSTLLHVRDHLRTIEHRDNGSSLKIIAADSETVSGKKASAVLIDELWLFGKKPHAEAMLREATGGLASRPEGFVFFLSTQSDEPPQGVFKAKLQYARDVRDGAIEDRKFLPLIYEFPRGMIERGEHLKPENLYLPNPNLGRSVDREWLVDELRKAQAAGGESLRVFSAKHLNLQVGLAQRHDGWIGAEHWQECEDETLTLEGLLEWADGVVIGVDVGGSEDVFSLSLLARRKPEEGRAHWRALNRSWFYESSLSRRQAVQSALTDFIKAGELTLIQESNEAYDEIADLVRRVDEAGLLLAVGVDSERPGDLPEVLADVVDVD